MPQLKWERIMPYDTGRGSNADIVGPGGSPILMVMNGTFGPEGFPHHLRFGMRPAANALVNDGQATGVAGSITVGPTAVMYLNNGNVNDVNATAGIMRYAFLPNSSGNSYQVFKGGVGTQLAVSGMEATALRAPYGSYGQNFPQAALYGQPTYWVGNGCTPTPLCLLVSGARASTGNTPVTALGYPITDATVQVVTANAPSQPYGPTVPVQGAFMLYKNATNWFLTRAFQDGSGGIVFIDPMPTIGFNTTNIEQYPVWGGFDTAAAVNATLDVHADGTLGAYVGGRTVEYFQGRVVVGSVNWFPRYTAAADKLFPLRRPNRLVWTILNGETPTRGPYKTNSTGLTQLQFPWSVEVFNYVDVDGIGEILQLVNMGDNQLVIFGDKGVARLTGYLTTAVSGVNASTFDVRPILNAPGIRYTNAAVLTRKGIYYIGQDSIYLYDGNEIHDVLQGSIKSYFVTPFTETVSNYPILACWTGVIDENHIYFSGITGNRGISTGDGSGGSNFGAGRRDGGFILNIETGKWSTFGLHENFGRSWPMASSVPGQWYALGTGNAAKVFRGVVFTGTGGGQSGKLKLPPIFNTDLTQSGQNFDQQFDLEWDFPDASPKDRFVIALRPIGQPGIAKRFVHLVVNYGFIIISGTATVNVRAIFGADYGWPNANVNSSVLLGTLTAISGTANNGGQLPNLTQRIAFNETSFQNPPQAGTAAMGWADAVQLSFELVYGSNGVDKAMFRLYSVDVSYVERPGMGHVVMGAA